MTPRRLAPVLLAGLAGLVFGLGLAVSRMVDPARVLGFLDVAGEWDPTLAFVMAGALAVTLPAFRWLPRRQQPWLGGRFQLPTRQDVDARLVAGAMLFGVGWGIAGLCPGPALAALASGLPEVVGFVVAMAVGNAAAGRLT
ncbi:DUF6691 family protein [Spiribacter halobius]|uniref:YeeE/YedE family protein n=1 Tax=Sediminicurvatus halobius TaxID=2182432 RepID=A0A2U2MWP7_9GAMM|nr:DUF6691 family protein [Spiribacter halobius]PWG61280.1 hypothetical protein DEM34_17305 [Spiribacter halobius]UEX78410.1 YeeE/YedE family protein [Spiribacter halobius]